MTSENTRFRGRPFLLARLKLPSPIRRYAANDEASNSATVSPMTFGVNGL